MPACGAVPSEMRSGRRASVAGPAVAAGGTRGRGRRGAEAARRLDLPLEKGRAADEAGDEPVGRALVESCCVPTCRTRPSFMTTRRSAIVSASSWSCVTMTVVRPSLRCSSRISTRTSCRSLASRFDSGSSSSSTSGWKTSARASATRCCWPPESWRGRRSPRCPRRTSRSASATRAARSPAVDLAHLQPEGDVLRHRQMREQRVALEHQAGIALPRRQSRDVAPAEPHVPRVGSTKPAIMRSVVVLPQPDGPSSTTNSPSATSSVTSRTAWTRRSAW